MTIPTRAWLLLAALLLTGCKVYSTIDIANTEIPERMSIGDFPPDLTAKYTVDDIIVRPLFTFSDGYQTEYKLLVGFYSKTHPVDVSITAVTLKINGQAVEYGREMIGAPTSEWHTGPTIQPYFACGISGEPISRPLSEMTQSTVDLSLTVAVKKADGAVVEKEITAHFAPTKRSHFFTM
ncbi:MAG: hypothetical protein HZA24_12135 [Nitrospirae bacterium]|nr:hypothetical protein [Nitrospirota bacterium]